MEEKEPASADSDDKKIGADRKALEESVLEPLNDRDWAEWWNNVKEKTVKPVNIKKELDKLTAE